MKYCALIRLQIRLIINKIRIFRNLHIITKLIQFCKKKKCERFVQHTVHKKMFFFFTYFRIFCKLQENKLI